MFQKSTRVFQSLFRTRFERKNSGDISLTTEILKLKHILGKVLSFDTLFAENRHRLIINALNRHRTQGGGTPTYER